MIYIENITSKNNKKIIEVCKLKDKKHRDKSGLFYFEGIKLFEEAIKSSVIIDSVFFTEENYDLISSVIFPSSTKLYKINHEVYDKLTDDLSPEGVFCVAHFLNNISICGNICYNTQNRFIMLYDVQNPGNVGTIIRTSNAFGIDAVILTKNCADIYNSKTIRSSMGSVFKQQIYIIDSAFDTINEFKKKKVKTISSVLDKNSILLNQNVFTKNDCLIVGNEGNGIPSSIYDICDEKIYIPISKNCESLNVATATAVMLWEMIK